MDQLPSLLFWSIVANADRRQDVFTDLNGMDRQLFFETFPLSGLTERTSGQFAAWRARFAELHGNDPDLAASF